jgi:hypothetical protein
MVHSYEMGHINVEKSVNQSDHQLLASLTERDDTMVIIRDEPGSNTSQELS